MSLTGTRSCVEKINEYLTEADAAFKKGAPFPEKFDFLGTFEEIEELPFSAVTDFKIVVESMPIEHAGYAISLVAAINTAFPEIGVEGKCYNKKPAFGKRNIYNLQADCGVETLEIVQKYEDAMPGDTRVPEPIILDDGGEPTKNETSEKAALRSELDGLGMFKFFEKKALKSKIETADQALRTRKGALDQAKKSKAALPSLESAYENARKECQKNFG